MESTTIHRATDGLIPAFGWWGARLADTLRRLADIQREKRRQNALEVRQPW